MTEHLPAVIEEIRSWPDASWDRFEREASVAIRSWGDDPGDQDEDDEQSDAGVNAANPTVDTPYRELGNDLDGDDIADFVRKLIVMEGGRWSNIIRARTLQVAGVSLAAISKVLGVDARGPLGEWERFSSPPIPDAPAARPAPGSLRVPEKTAARVTARAGAAAWKDEGENKGLEAETLRFLRIAREDNPENYAKATELSGRILTKETEDHLKSREDPLDKGAEDPLDEGAEGGGASDVDRVGHREWAETPD
jgi:hypothetical protein